MNGRIVFSLLLAASFLSPLAAAGTVRYVAHPSQFPTSPMSPYDDPLIAASTIGDAIGVSEAGDSILVAGIPFEVYLGFGYRYDEAIRIPRERVLIGGWDYMAAYNGYPSVNQRLFDADSLWTMIGPSAQVLAVDFIPDSSALFDTTTIDTLTIVDTVWIFQGPESNTVFSGFVVFGADNQDSLVDGGGMRIRFGSPSVTYNVFSNNRTLSRGGALFLGAGSPTIAHNTFALNIAGAGEGALHVTGGRPSIRDNIFFSTVGGFAVACTDSADSVALAYNLFYKNGSGDTFGCSPDSSNRFGIDPVFCDPEGLSGGYDFRLYSESAIEGLASDGSMPGAWAFGCRARVKYVSMHSDSPILPYDDPAHAAPSLSEGLAIAFPSDTIRMALGEYSENASISTALVITGGWETDFSYLNHFGRGTVLSPADSSRPALSFSAASESDVSFLVLTGAAAGEGSLVRVDSGTVRFRNISIVGNDSTGESGGSLVHVGAAASAAFAKSMFALNEERSVFGCDEGASITLDSCDLFQNDQDFAPGCTPVLTDTLSVDPFFCEPDSGDYRFHSEGSLGGDSEGTNPIGALSVGCSYTAHFVVPGSAEGVYPYETPEHATSDIESVLDVALGADTVRFAAGTYDVSLELSRMSFLEGGWNDSTFTERSPGEYLTVLRGVEAGRPVLLFTGVFNEFAVPGGISGFVITHAEGVEGPGIVVESGARPRIVGNLIEKNRVDFGSNPEYRAAGLILAGASADTEVVATVIENTIVDNEVVGATVADSVGSAVFIRNAGTGSSERTEFRSNICAYNTGGMAGMVYEEVWLTFADNLFYANLDAAGGESPWAALALGAPEDSLFVDDPAFCDADSGDWFLRTCSPAILSATGDTVIGALPVSDRCICEGEAFLVFSVSQEPGFPYSSRRNAAHRISDLDTILTAGDTVKVAADQFEDEFELVGGVVYRGGYGTESFSEEGRGEGIITRVSGGARHRIVHGGAGVDTTTRIEGFQFASGQADSGGIILLTGDASPVFSDNQFIESRAEETGAVVLALDESAPRFYRNLAYRNTGGEEGALFHLAGSGGILANNTISDNPDGGWAIRVDSLAPEIYNNSITFDGAGVKARGSAGIVFENNNVFHQGGEDYDVDFDPLTAENALTADDSARANISNGPAYCDWLQEDYYLFDHSPNIAAGRSGSNIGVFDVRCSTPTHFVSPDGSDTYPYATEATAAHAIQDAIEAAAMAGFSNPADSIDEVRVVAGIYADTIRLRTNVRLRGGYSPDFEERDPDLYPTVIDAEGMGTAVVIDSGAGGEGRATTEIDGFEIRNGAGVVGGGIRVERGAAPRIGNTRIDANRAEQGGGMYIAPWAFPSVEYTVFYHDTAARGAAVYRDTMRASDPTTVSSSTLLWYNTYVENHVTGGGGAIHFTDHDSIVFPNGEPRMMRSIVTGTTGGLGLFQSEEGQAFVTDNQFYGNEGGDSIPGPLSGDHVIADPIFCDSTGASFGVLYDLARIDAGLSPVRDTCATIVWGAGGIGCTEPGHRWLVNWDRVGANTPVFPYVCARNAAPTLQDVLPYVNAGDIVDVAGDGPDPHAPLDGAIYEGGLELTKPIELRGGFDPDFLLESPRPDSFDLRTVIAAPQFAKNGDGGGSLLIIRQDSAAADSSLLIDSTSIISGFFFYGGEADLDNGGAIRCKNGASPTIRDCSFLENSTKNWGGAISFDGGDSPRIYNNYFFRNRAGLGGGVYFHETSDPVVRRNIFSQNDADLYGGIRLERVTGGGSIDNNVFLNNSGGGVSLSEAVDGMEIRNNVIVANGGYGISLAPTFEGITEPTLSYNNVWANSSGPYENLIAGEGAVSMDPLFCNTVNPVDSVFHGPKADFFRYQACSPMLMAGSDTSSVLDAHIGYALLDDPACPDTVSPGIGIGFLMHSAIPNAANLFVVPTEEIARDSIVLRLMYADAALETVEIGDDVLIDTVYHFDSTIADLTLIDATRSVYRSGNVVLRSADTLVVEARVVDLCGKSGLARRAFSSYEFSKGKAGSFRSTDGRMVVRIPAASFARSGVALLGLHAPYAAEGDKRPLAGPYGLQIDQIHAVGPIDLAVSAGGLGVEEEEWTGLAIYRREGDHWEHLDSRIDPSRKTVLAKTARGGIYALFYAKDVESEVVVPERFALYGNAPNPFNPITKIRFDLPERSEVALRIYDVRGRLIRTLVDEPLPAGRYAYTWNGKNGSGRAVGSGVYFYRLAAGERRATRKMILIR